jgi:hypothetical protein
VTDQNGKTTTFTYDDADRLTKKQYPTMPLQPAPFASQRQKEQAPMAWFYEIRDSNNVTLKRDGGYATQDAAKIAGRADAKKIRNAHQPGRTDVGTILVGQNAQKPTR